MASQHTGVRQTPITYPNLPPQLDRKMQPQKDSLPLVEEVITPDPDDVLAKAELKREADRQIRFQNVANNMLGSPHGYLEVEILIIRWDESIDEFDGHTQEIARLEKIFTKGYGYNCKIARLTNHRDPQIGLNMAILKHIQDHDHQNTLLIVYYTGHGVQRIENTKPRLELSATRHFSANSGHAPTAFWDEAEKPLRQNTSSDTLVILDCCYASTAGLKGCNQDSRTYQLLAASATRGYTTGPGQKSFTTALCDSLEELLLESKGESFPVIKLSERISTKRPDHSAVVWDLLGRYKRNVELGHLVRNPERESSFQKETPEQASLLLRFSLGTNELKDVEIDQLALHLSEACKQAKIHVRRIEWVKMKHRNPTEVFRKAAKAALRMNRRQSSPGKEQRRRSSQEHKKRARSETSAISIPKSTAREGSPLFVETKVSDCLASPVPLDEVSFPVSVAAGFDSIKE